MLNHPAVFLSSVSRLCHGRGRIIAALSVVFAAFAFTPAGAGEKFGDQLSYPFTAPDSHIGVIHSAEWSPDMTPGSWLPLTVFKLATAGRERAFMRLRVTTVAP